MRNRFIQAYKQAPWRTQVQWIGLFSLGLVIIGLVAWVYLSVSASSAATGREVQALQNNAIDLTNKIADMESQLGQLTSVEYLQAKAKDLGFVPVAPGEAKYITVPGYPGRQAAVIAPPPAPPSAPATLLRPDYTKSLWDILFAGISPASGTLEQVQR